MDPRPVNYPGWRRNANLFEGYSGPPNRAGQPHRQSMRLIVQRQEPYRRYVTSNEGWATLTPDYSRAIRQFQAFQLSPVVGRTVGAQGLLEWWQYWSLRRIRSSVSQFVRRRIPRIDGAYRLRRATERTSGPSELFRLRNWVPGTPNLIIGKRTFSQMLDG